MSRLRRTCDLLVCQLKDIKYAPFSITLKSRLGDTLLHAISVFVSPKRHMTFTRCNAMMENSVLTIAFSMWMLYRAVKALQMHWGTSVFGKYWKSCPCFQKKGDFWRFELFWAHFHFFHFTTFRPNMHLFRCISGVNFLGRRFQWQFWPVAKVSPRRDNWFFSIGRLGRLSIRPFGLRAAQLVMIWWYLHHGQTHMRLNHNVRIGAKSISQMDGRLVCEKSVRTTFPSVLTHMRRG